MEGRRWITTGASTSAVERFDLSIDLGAGLEEEVEVWKREREALAEGVVVRERERAVEVVEVRDLERDWDLDLAAGRCVVSWFGAETETEIVGDATAIQCTTPHQKRVPRTTTIPRQKITNSRRDGRRR